MLEKITMNLRDLISPASETLLPDFQLDKDDIPYIYQWARQQRRETRQEYDYSLETKVFLSYWYHRCRERSVPEGPLSAIVELQASCQEHYTRPGNKLPFYRQKKRAFQQVWHFPEGGVMSYAFTESMEHFTAAQDEHMRGLSFKSQLEYLDAYTTLAAAIHDLLTMFEAVR